MLWEYNGAKVTITRTSDWLKPIQHEKFRYIDYSEDLENSDDIIYDWLIEDTVFRQWNHYSEPFDVEI